MKYCSFFIKLTLPVFLLALFFSCGPRKDRGDQVPSNLDSLMVTYQALNDSLANAWDKMITDDNAKLANLKRLIEEVTYTNNYDPALTDSLTRMIDQLEALRYDQQSMSDSDLIDEYDSATMDVVNKITKLAMDHPAYENHPMMQQLIDEIQQSQNMLFIYRVRYDEVAKAINQFIDENNKELIENDVTQTDYPKRPLFQISG